MESRIFDQSRISLLLYIPLLFAVETTAKNNAGLSHRKCGTFSLAQPQPQFFSPSKMKTLSSCLSVHQASHFTSESVTDWDPLSFWMANTWLGGKGQSDIFTSFCIEFSSFPQNLFNFFFWLDLQKKTIAIYLDVFFSLRQGVQQSGGLEDLLCRWWEWRVACECGMEVHLTCGDTAPLGLVWVTGSGLAGASRATQPPASASSRLSQTSQSDWEHHMWTCHH